MKYRSTFKVKVLLFLFAVIFLASCGQGDDQEQARIEHVEFLSSRMSKLKIWSHGPKHTYATISSNDPQLEIFTEEQLRRICEETLTMPEYAHMVELGYTKLYFYTLSTKIELYADKKENCWKFK